MPVIETSNEQAADITVKYNDPPKPGKKWGSISDGTARYSGPPSLLEQFPVGGTYRLLWKPFGDNGTGKAIVRRLDSVMAAPKQNERPAMASREARQIAILAIAKLVAPVQLGTTDAMADAMTRVVLAATTTYDRTLSGVQSQTRDDLDDSINF